jgi:hypothetical protein
MSPVNKYTLTDQIDFLLDFAQYLTDHQNDWTIEAFCPFPY